MKAAFAFLQQRKKWRGGEKFSVCDCCCRVKHFFSGCLIFIWGEWGGWVGGWEGGRPFIDEAEVEDVICCRIKVHLNFAMT
jgi:hypothetical protein